MSYSHYVAMTGSLITGYLNELDGVARCIVKIRYYIKLERQLWSKIQIYLFVLAKVVCRDDSSHQKHLLMERKK